MTLLLALLACQGAPPAATSVVQVAPLPGVDPAPTALKLYTVTWKTDPRPLPLSTLFEIEATLTDAKGAPVEDAKVRIDARMPQHGHGMATRPEDDEGVCDAAGACTHPGGVYRTRGMKFHMPGEWSLRFDVDGPAGTDHLLVPVQL